MSEIVPRSTTLAVLTVRDILYHQAPEEEVVAVEDGYEISLTTSEEPFPKTYILGPDPQPLDLGWLPEGGLVHLKNYSKDQWARYRYKDGPCFLIPPLGTARFWPEDPSEIELFAAGKVKLSATVFPK